MFGSVSRAQFNPSVTLAFLTLSRKLITAHEALLIWLAEFLGASLAAVTFYLLTPKPGSVPLFEFNGASACFEVIWTAILVLVILNINTCQADSKLSGGFFNGGAIALTVVAAAYSAGSIAPAYLNPCVTFGIAVAHLIGTGGTDSTATRLFGFMAVQFAASILAVVIFSFTNGARELRAKPPQAEKQDKEVYHAEKERVGGPHKVFCLHPCEPPSAAEPCEGPCCPYPCFSGVRVHMPMGVGVFAAKDDSTKALMTV
mmetsp:Transcript_4129/g.10677  ORF Transcript_4129/g.10677 Transcript_4129/m.10677 type:complete len:258 (+) Transcript_4129:406-1179(+)